MMFNCSNVFLLMFLLIAVACNDTTEPALNTKDLQSTNTHRNKQKPGSSYSDTIQINQACAVFYQPDSLQYLRIRAANDPGIFESMDHELFYQSRNAKIELSANWRHLHQLTVKDARYLLFILGDKRSRLIDLDSMQDMCGLFLFEPSKDPQNVDMMNIDSETSDYFGNRPGSKHD